MNLNRQSQKRKGFTLIELIMTLVVVGIISAACYSSRSARAALFNLMIMRWQRPGTV